MRLQATHGPTYQHYHEHAYHIDPEHLSEQDPKHLQPYEWVHYPIENSGEVKSSHTMGISDAWSHPLWVVTVEITYKTKDRLRIDRLDAPHSFTKTIKHPVIRSWALIDSKQITNQPLTRNLSDHELTTRTLEPYLPRNKKTRANKQRHTNPI